MIKAQTAMTGGEQGGREEGREGGAFPGETGQAGYAEGEGGGEGGGETQGWLVPSKGCVLTGALYTLVSKRGGQNSCWPLPDVQNTGEEHKLHGEQHKFTNMWPCAQTNTNHGHIHSYNTCKSRQAVTCTSSVLLADGDLNSGNEIQFLCCNFYGDKTLEDSTVCPVCNRISLFLPFLLLSFFFFWQACFVDCFSSACCPFYLCLLPFFLPLFLRLPLSPLAQSGLSGL